MGKKIGMIGVNGGIEEKMGKIDKRVEVMMKMEECVEEGGVLGKKIDKKIEIKEIKKLVEGLKSMVGLEEVIKCIENYIKEFKKFEKDNEEKVIKKEKFIGK
jgi:NAD/NADP transhydrogenase beta subunit